jgi:hypothetical protein
MISFRQFSKRTRSLPSAFSVWSELIAISILAVFLLAGIQAVWLVRANHETRAACELESLGATVAWAWKFDSLVQSSPCPCYQSPSFLLPGDSFVVSVRLLECRDENINTKLACLESLRGIRALAFTDEKITDAALEHVIRLTNLEWLNLYSASVTDDGLQHLAGLEKLQWLNLCGTRVTASGVACLRSQLPAAKIYSDFDGT